MIKKILVLVFLLCGFLARGVSASEIFGNISTNPKNPSNIPSASTGAVINNSLAAGINNTDASKKETEPIIKKEVINTQENKPVNIQPSKETATPMEKVVVLGEVYYPDGALLRGEDKKTYLIMDGVKKYIKNLLELQKYRGKKIYKVSYADLDRYKTRNYLDGELIRQKNRVEVYVVEKGSRKHVINLKELRQFYAGLVINNISVDEMADYIAK